MKTPNMVGERNTLPPLSIVRMLWKRRALIAAVSVLLCATSGGVVYKLRPLYKAEAVILVDAQKIPEKFVSSTVTSDVTDRLAVISQEILSTTRLLKIIHDLDLYKEERESKTQEEIVEQMRRDISVNVQKDNWATGKPVAFKIGYQGSSPTVVAEVTNQLANLYIEENLQTREVEAAGTSEFIDNQLEQAKKELDEEELKVAKFKQEHNGSLPEQENPLLSNLSNLRLQLQGVQDSINRSQQNKLMLETALSTEESALASMQQALQAKATASSTTSDVTGATSSETDSDGKSLLVLERTLDEMKSRYTSDHPDVIALEARIAQLKQTQRDEAVKQAAANEKAMTADSHESSTGTTVPAPSPAVSRDLLQERGKIAILRGQLAGLKRDLEFEESERARILQQITSTQAHVDQLPLVEQQMAGLTRDYDTSKANYKSLLDKRNAAEMSTDMERRQKSERFEIIDPARVPSKPFKPNRSLWLSMSIVASLLLSLVLGFGLEFRANNLLGEWELPENIVVLGRVPLIEMHTGATAKSTAFRILAVSSATAFVLVAAAYYILKVRN